MQAFSIATKFLRHNLSTTRKHYHDDPITGKKPYFITTRRCCMSSSKVVKGSGQLQNSVKTFIRLKGPPWFQFHQIDIWKLNRTFFCDNKFFFLCFEMTKAHSCNKWPFKSFQTHLQTLNNHDYHKTFEYLFVQNANPPLNFLQLNCWMCWN